jgi:pimeloyl-ACP methyl ester carboxylesterase
MEATSRSVHPLSRLPRIDLENAAMIGPRIVRLSLAGLIAAGNTGALHAQPASASSARPNAPAEGRGSRARSAAKPTIVLVHGAFADGTGWQRVIPILERDGYSVIAVQNPLASLAGDVQTTKRVIDAQTGPVVAVGHSYGGAVITGAAAGNANVKALVYIAAFAPDANEPIGAFGEKYPTALGTALRPDAAGYLYIDRARFRELFANDVSATDASVMAAAQKPIIGTVFGSSVQQAAWKTIPSWYVVAQEDRAINPELERFYARRMGAKTTEIKSSHVAFISHPAEVARVIEQAASAAVK